MRITIGRGKNRTSIAFPTGKNVGVTAEHVAQMMQILQSRGVKLVGRFA